MLNNLQKSISVTLAAMLLTGAIFMVSSPAVAFAAKEDGKKGKSNDYSMTENKGMHTAKRASNQGVASGTISSIQNDVDGKPAWISSGTWRLIVISPSAASNNGTAISEAKFTAKFTMVKFDGMSAHKHIISDLNMTSISNTGNVTTIIGTATMTMKDAPQKNIPITIKMMNHSTISISLDANANAHLGNTPLYGVVSRINSSYHSMTHSQVQN